MLDDARHAAPTITLREYRGDDLESIFRLDEVCFTKEFRFGRASMRRFAEAKSAITLVAENATGPDTYSITGFVIVHVERLRGERCGYVVTLDVTPEHRRMGLAGRMMDAVESRAAAVGASCMELHVFTENDAAIRFYEARGYGCLGMQEGFYGSGLDALVYRKELR
jgi:[ribosomal protein S18]-alanine N-acetyltransferase